MLGTGRRLYLPYDEKSDVGRAIKRAFANDPATADRVIPLPETAPMYDDLGVLSLSALAAGLARLPKEEQKNLLVLMPQGISWSTNGLGRGSVLDWVGFVLLRDFVAGVPVDLVGLTNISRLAEVISSQA